MSTYTLIQSQTLASSAASVTFSAIPATYTDLVLKASARSDAAGTDDGITIVLNSDTSSNYSQTWISGSGSAAATNRSSSAAKFGAAGWIMIDTSGNTTNTFSNTEFYIPSYTVAQSKPMSFDTRLENNSTLAYITTTAGLWSNTATISTILLALASGGNYVTGSSFYLYGISNA